ncbi:pentapeptide repeat-containing protein [Streptomyces tirandamycinicus]|uniref:Pentapeptide repeat-containing protein n=1 Tax=Streptomyces tirandamycinicus TaxID=2174846 RepID=A0A2S1T3R3_9ACTN|nr:pentapeptide repeat-containing protein [Streptomyces tirandamycinicus]AWI33167.1 pentapeptide repeat-containing protein [Streptomyces tirandamycinicus]
MGSKLSQMSPLARWACVAIAVAGVLVLFTVVLWRLPWWLDHKYLNKNLSAAQGTVVSGLRTVLTALGGGALVAAGLVYTHRTVELSREGHVTDRFSTAISQVASDKPLEQLGGIYALERIMRDSAKDHVTIVEVLASFVREHAPLSDPPTKKERPQHTESVQAALTVLSRRPRDRAEPFIVNLQRTDLRGADLSDAHLPDAWLRGTNLEGAWLEGANFRGAQLLGANLDSAQLRGAHLEGSLLGGADLSKAKGLTVEQLVTAFPTSFTDLPWDLARDPRVRARIDVAEEELHELAGSPPPPHRKLKE